MVACLKNMPPQRSIPNVLFLILLYDRNSDSHYYHSQILNRSKELEFVRFGSV